MADGDQSIRAFFALGLSEEVRARLASRLEALRLAPWSRGVRWARPETWHLTVRFLGEVESETILRLRESVAEVAFGLPAFDLEVGAFTLFPSHRRPRIVAADADGGEALRALAEGIEAAVVAEGLPGDDRPLRAHITLGRVRRGTTGLPRLEPSPIGDRDAGRGGHALPQPSWSPAEPSTASSPSWCWAAEPARGYFSITSRIVQPGPTCSSAWARAAGSPLQCTTARRVRGSPLLGRGGRRIAVPFDSACRADPAGSGAAAKATWLSLSVSSSMPAISASYSGVFIRIRIPIPL